MKINKAKNEKGHRFTFEGKHTQSEQIVRGEVVATNEDEAKKKYRMLHRRFWSTVMYVEPDGTLNMEANTDTSDDIFYFLFTYSDGYWKIVGSKSEQELKES